MAATYDFSQTRNQIILRALRICGVVAQGDDPTGEQVAEAAQALESLVKALQGEGTQLWSVEDRTQAITAGVASYTLGTDVLGVEMLELRDSSSYATRLGLVDDHIFSSVTQPTKTGKPEMGRVEMRTADSVTLKLWPVPDVNYTLYYKVVRKMADFDTAVGTPEMPQRWYDALVYTLASNLADEYQLPLQDRSYLVAKAQALRDMASERLDNEPADTIYLRAI